MTHSMILKVVDKPPATGGRSRISGTVLRDSVGARYVAVRLVFSLGENEGNSGSPRVELWIALKTPDFLPAIIRGVGGREREMDWSVVSLSDVGPIRVGEALSAIRLATHSPDGGPLDVTNPTIWGVVWPHLKCYPKNKASLKPPLKSLLEQRHSSDDALALDAMILNLAPRARA